MNEDIISKYSAIIKMIKNTELNKDCITLNNNIRKMLYSIDDLTYNKST